MNFGLDIEDLNIVKSILEGYKPIVFGSRSKGTHRQFSDLDICFKEPISEDKISDLKEDLVKSDLPITVDLAHYNDMPDFLQKSVDEIGIPLFE